MTLRTMPVSAASAIMGTSAAVLMGNMEIFPAILCLLFAMLAQISANIYHRYCEDRMLPAELRRFNDSDSDGHPSLNVMREGSIAIAMLALLVGFGLEGMGGWWTLPVGAAIIGAVFLYNNSKYPLSRSPFSPVVAFIFFGPVAVLCTCFIQSSHGAAHAFTWLDLGPAIYNSVIAGLMAVNVLLVHNCVSAESDRKRGRRTLVVSFAPRTAQAVIIGNGVLVLVACVIFAVSFKIPGINFSLFIPAIYMVSNTWIGIMAGRPGPHLTENRLQFYSALNMLAIAVIQFAFFFYVGKPDDSTTSFFGQIM